MKVKYDKYYETVDLFGKPYPELIEFYTNVKVKGNLLDLGCGQGRDSIPLAKLGFNVTGIDNSKVGIDQLNIIAIKENLPLIGIVDDIYSFSNFNLFEFILLDSMFHFAKKDKEKEISFLERLITESKTNTLITICIQYSGKKIEILNSVILKRSDLKLHSSKDLEYKYVDRSSNHSSVSQYKMITIEKLKTIN
jgi:SAM-dependent methyltransferase